MAATSSEPPLPNKIEDLYEMMGENGDEEFEIKQSELDQLKVALKDETFRKLLSNYVEEVRDPENQVTYQSELRQLEKERGNIVHFINPTAGYVLKTSVNGDKKCFINICSNPLIRKPSMEAGVQDNKYGSVWSIPYSQSQGREDYDKGGKMCMVYDVIFNPEALELANRNSVLKEKLEETAIEAVETSFKLSLDKVNIRRPKLKYKGMRNAATIKYKLGEAPPHVLDPTQLGKEQPPEKDGPCPQQKSESSANSKGKSKKKGKSGNAQAAPDIQQEPLPISKIEMDYSKWTKPKYGLKYRSHVDMQNYCTEFQRQDMDSNVPDEIVLTIDLPLLKDSSSLDADVVDDGDGFELKSDEKALYWLKVKFPYKVIADSAKATFDKDKRKLSVCMKTMKITSQLKTMDASFQDLSLDAGEVSEKIGEDLASGDDGGSAYDVPSFNDNGINTPLQPLFEDPFEEDSGNCSPEVGSPAEKKTVRFSDDVKQLIFRSNSSILGQRKKNQRKAKSRRKRLNSVESTSSVDEDDEFGGGDGAAKAVRQRFSSGGSISSLDDEDFSKYSASY